MLLQPIWEWLQAQVFTLPVLSEGSRPQFNPYQGVNPSVDRPGADRIRRENLRRYLQSFNSWPEVLVVGEAPGWRGCRFSGVPFTSEAQLNGELPFAGEQSSLGAQPYREATATIFWRVMRKLHPRFLAWNNLPLHPHQLGKPLSNRTPAPEEIRAAERMLAELIALLEPKWIVAVGKSAQTALQYLGIAPICVRHPGHGGAKAFEIQMQALFCRQNASPEIADLYLPDNRL